MKTCFTCKLPKTLEEFGNNKNRPDGKQKYCKVCSRLKDKKHYSSSDTRKEKIRERNQHSRKRHQQLVIDYLSSNPCVDCNESEILFLDFDHVNGKKSYNVSHMMCMSTKTIMAEIAKCVVRCIKCHRRKTAKEQGWFKNDLNHPKSR